MEIKGAANWSPEARSIGEFVVPLAIFGKIQDVFFCVRASLERRINAQSQNSSPVHDLTIYTIFYDSFRRESDVRR